MRSCRLLILFTAISGLYAAVNERDTFYWAGKLPPGQVVEIKGVNGGIRAELADGNTLEVVAQKEALFSDPANVRVQVVEHDQGVTVRAVYGDNEEGAGSDVRVDFLVRVPAGVHFVARTVNGGVDGSAPANAEAHTVNGDIHLSAGGTAQADTVNGSIVASLAEVRNSVHLATINGQITLEIPPSRGLRLEANTVNGPITADFPLQVRGNTVSKHASRVIGRGGPDVKLNTVNGAIHLRRTSHRKG
jgi:hypothetical protein